MGTIGGIENRFGSTREALCDASRYAFVDVEVGLKDRKIHDIGAVRWDGAIYHSANKRGLMDFLDEVDFVCGHNIINHDAKYLFDTEQSRYMLVDTLYVSPLLFPERPYHRLLKDDKLLSDHCNNPVNDCEKARDLLTDEAARWKQLSATKQQIFAALIGGYNEFRGFLAFVNAKADCNTSLEESIRQEFRGKICENVDLKSAINNYPCELAYALSLIDTSDHHSITPPLGSA